MVEQRLDLDKPLWDQSTFLGRWKHFAWITDFRTCMVSEDELISAKNLCLKYRFVLIEILRDSTKKSFFFTIVLKM